VLLNAKIPLRSFYRTIYFLPVMVPVVCSAIVWAWLLNTRVGLINNVLMSLGVRNPPGWLTSMQWVKPSLLMMEFWAQGRAIVVFLAALQTVPTYMYENADLEGANVFQKFWNITIPMISPVVLINLVMSIIQNSQFFAQPFIMTNGGPGTASLVYAMYLYQNAFRYMRMGYAASMTWFLFILVISVTIVVFRTSGRWVYRASS
jgi:multiple sugar transport system permease protein